jgi:hypothetical protein
MKSFAAKFGVLAHLVLVPVTRLSHLHLVLRVNHPSPALAAHFRAVVPHPSPAQVPVLLHFHLALHLVLRLALSHHLPAAALSHHRVLLFPAHAAALRLAIRPLAQAAPVLVSQAHLVALPLLAALHLASHHLALVLHPVIQPSLLLVPLAAHPLAAHLHLQARVSKSYKASISIQIVSMAAGLLALWDLAPVWQIASITAYSGLDSHLGRMIPMVSKVVTVLLLDFPCQIQFSREKR